MNFVSNLFLPASILTLTFVLQSKGGFEKCRKKQDATQTESNNDSSNQKVRTYFRSLILLMFFFKLAKRLLSETKASEKADEAYKKSVEKMKVMEGRFYDSELPQILKVGPFFFDKGFTKWVVFVGL